MIEKMAVARETFRGEGGGGLRLQFVNSLNFLC